MDFRTVETLQHSGRLDKSGSRHFFRDTTVGYDVFRRAMLKIARENPKWSLREIDRALFAYHERTMKLKKHRS